jgi:hypothetical protein
MLVTNAKEEVTRVTEVSPRVDQNAVYKMQKRAPTITDFFKLSGKSKRIASSTTIAKCKQERAE